MEIVYHIGAHGTEQDRLTRTLLRNRDTLWKHEVDIPSPNRYRGVFGDAINALNGAEASADMQETLLDALLDNDGASRLILSQPGFLGMPKRSISAEGLYPKAPQRISGLSNLFPDRAVEFFLTLLHPAALVAEVVRSCNGNYLEVMADVDPMCLRWAPAVRQMLSATEDRELVIWAREDLPFIWPEILRRMARIGLDVPLVGEMAILEDLLPAERIAHLDAEFAAHEGLSIRERREMIEAELDAHALPGADETELLLPDWTQALIDEMSEDYAEDLAEIAALPGVEFISA